MRERPARRRSSRREDEQQSAVPVRIRKGEGHVLFWCVMSTHVVFVLVLRRRA